MYIIGLGSQEDQDTDIRWAFDSLAKVNIAVKRLKCPMAGSVMYLKAVKKGSKTSNDPLLVKKRMSKGGKGKGKGTGRAVIGGRALKRRASNPRKSAGKRLKVEHKLLLDETLTTDVAMLAPAGENNLQRRGKPVTILKTFLCPIPPFFRFFRKYIHISYAL